MVNRVRIFGIAALLATAGFVFASCAGLDGTFGMECDCEFTIGCGCYGGTGCSCDLGIGCICDDNLGYDPDDPWF